MPNNKRLETELRRMNTLMISTGFGPMEAQEIEKVLEQQEPKRAMPGITHRPLEEDRDIGFSSGANPNDLIARALQFSQPGAMAGRVLATPDPDVGAIRKRMNPVEGPI